MKAGKDFCYVTRDRDGHLWMWIDEPFKNNDGVWVGKQPYVNSYVYNQLDDILKNRILDEPEMITWT
jgi:hypothetical protein